MKLNKLKQEVFEKFTIEIIVKCLVTVLLTGTIIAIFRNKIYPLLTSSITASLWLLLILLLLVCLIGYEIAKPRHRRRQHLREFNEFKWCVSMSPNSDGVYVSVEKMPYCKKWRN